MECFCRNCEHWLPTMGGKGECETLGEMLRQGSATMAHKIEVVAHDVSWCEMFEPSLAAQDADRKAREAMERDGLLHKFRRDIAPPREIAA